MTSIFVGRALDLTHCDGCAGPHIPRPWPRKNVEDEGVRLTRDSSAGGTIRDRGRRFRACGARPRSGGGPGEVTALIGESGAGKSTVALGAIGLLPPNAQLTSGEILFEGADLLTMESAALRRVLGNRIAMVYADPDGAGDLPRAATSLDGGDDRDDGSLRPRARATLAADRGGARRSLSAGGPLPLPGALRRRDENVSARAGAGPIAGGCRQRRPLGPLLQPDPDPRLVAGLPSDPTRTRAWRCWCRSRRVESGWCPRRSGRSWRRASTSRRADRA